MNRVPEEPSFLSFLVKNVDDESEERCPDNQNDEILRLKSSTTLKKDIDEDSDNSAEASPVSWPVGLNFYEWKAAKSRGVITAACHKHMVEMSQAGIRLTDPDRTPMKLVENPSSKKGKKKSRKATKVEKAPVMGSPDIDLECVRHTTDFNYDAKWIFDIYVRLNYTAAIDAYTYLVELLESIDTSATSDSTPNDDNKYAQQHFRWAHVAYTGDKITPGFAHRDFVTFDFVDETNLMLVSRSCRHASRPQTSVPTVKDGIKGMFTKKPKRTFRSPLCYFLRVIPLSEGKCRVVQFQYSDFGGVIPPKVQTDAIVKFGCDNTQRFARLLQKAKERNVKVGPSTSDYLSDPLLPSWKQSVGDMIPGL